MKRLYVLIDESLNPIYGAVQGGHCVAQWLLDHPDQQWNNHTLVYLACNIEKEFIELRNKNKDFSYFVEPDLGNKLTTCAILGNKNAFKSLKLLA